MEIDGARDTGSGTGRGRGKGRGRGGGSSRGMKERFASIQVQPTCMDSPRELLRFTKTWLPAVR